MIFARLSKSTAILLAAVTAAAPGLASAPADPLTVRKSHATLIEHSIDRFILPRIATLKARSAALTTAVAAVCEPGAGDAARRSASTAFADTVRAWGGLDFIRFGPVARSHRLERIFFWPDPRATAARQLNGLVAAKQPALLEPGGLARQSVAVQGLTALEILLFDDKAPLGTGDDDAARYRCGLAHAIAANIDAVAGEIGAGWEGEAGYRSKMLRPGSDNALYKDASETAREVVRAIATGLQICRDRFVLPELTAITHEPPRRVRLPFERARLTGPFIAAQIAALEELFDVTGLAAYIAPDKPWMADFLPAAWKGLAVDAARLDALRADQPGSEMHLRALRKLRFDLGAVRLIIVRELAPNAEIVLGFNELDGD